MRFTSSRWRRMFGWAALILWPALLPRPADAVVACIWYPVLGLSGLAYFLSRVQDGTAEAGTRPAGDPSLSASSASSSRLPASVPITSRQPWPEEPDSHWRYWSSASRASRRMPASSVPVPPQAEEARDC